MAEDPREKTAHTPAPTASGADPAGGPDDPAPAIDVQTLQRALAQWLQGSSPPEAEGADGQEEEGEAAEPVLPRMIVEGALFVGHPENRPLSRRQLAGLVGGISPEEVDRLVRELNELYRQHNHPYEIVAEGAGYRLVLRSEWDEIRQRFYRRVRQARLSQAAVDILAIVAYTPGISRPEIQSLWGRPCAAILNQLVRRDLLRVEHDPANQRLKRYHVTERFLEIFGLESLDDLPQTIDWDRQW